MVVEDWWWKIGRVVCRSDAALWAETAQLMLFDIGPSENDDDNDDADRLSDVD